MVRASGDKNHHPKPLKVMEVRSEKIREYSVGGGKMKVRKVGERYRCNICGNEVTVTKVGGGELVCCGQPMELIS